MALQTNIRIDLSEFDLGGAVQDVIRIFIRKVAQEMEKAIAKVMPYGRRPGRRPMPPRSKTGRAIRSLRYTTRRKSANIYAVGYLRDLQEAGWDYVTPAWRMVKPRLQSLLNEAIQEVQA